MKILLLTDIPPNTSYPAALFLASLCRLLPHDAIACFAVVNPVLEAQVAPDLDWLPIHIERKPQEITNTKLGRIKRVDLWNWGWESYVSKVKVPQIAAKAIEFGRQQGCTMVWCTLEGQTLIRLARRVADGLGVPLHTQVFDPPFWWLRQHRVNGFSSREIVNEFDAAVQQSQSCATASWAMAEEYNQRYQTKTVPLIPSLDQALAYPAQQAAQDKGPFIIGMAGQLYAAAEWKALMDALSSVNWQIAGREVRMWVLSRNFEFFAKSRTHIEFFGWRSQQETINILSKASVLYCPYWFNPVFKTEARLSFPSKLVTYLAAGRPVLFHGPDYASPHRFLEQHNAAISCHSLQPDAILNSLNRLATDSSLYNRITQAGSRTFQQYLTTQSMRSAFAEFLGVNESFLLCEDTASPQIQPNRTTN